MTDRRAWLVPLIGLVLGLANCAPKPPPPMPPHVVVGAAYQAGGLWRYPRERYSGSETGLVAVYAEGHATLTTDGETFDQAALAGGHPTLQLPAIVSLTNLETGRSARLRINDRGPADPARALVVTRRVATLLGLSDGTRIRLTLDEGDSRAAVAVAGGAPGASLSIATAPREAITSADLPPPGSARAAGLARPLDAVSVSAPAVAAPPLRLPETVVQGVPEPGTLMIDLGRFGRRDLANRQAARSVEAGARVDAVRLGRETVYRAVAGPYAGACAADAALARILRAGVLDARIVID